MNRLMCKICCLLGSVVLLFSIGGCLLPGGSSGPRTFAVVLPSEPGQFWDGVRQGIEAAGEEFHIQFKFYLRSGNREEQLEIVRNALADRIDGILIAPDDDEAYTGLIDEAADQGISIVTIHSDVKTDNRVIHVTADHAQTAALALQGVREMGVRGKVAIVGEKAVNTVSFARQQQFVKAAEGATDIQVETVIKTNGDKRSVMAQTMELLNDNEVAGIIGVCDGCAVGAALAVRDMNLQNETAVFGFEGTQSEIRLLEEGLIAAIIVQNPIAMGYMSVKAAVDRLRGQRVQPHIYVESAMVTKQTLQLPEYQKLLYPFEGP